MILQALISYAERERLAVDDGTEKVVVHWGIYLDKNGKWNGTLPLLEAVGLKRLKPATFHRPFTSPNQLSHGAKSHFLCDTLERMLLYFDSASCGKIETRRRQQSYFKMLLEEAIDACPTESDYLHATLYFLNDEEALELCRQDLDNQKAKPTHNATFVIEGTNLLGLKKLRNFWRRRLKREETTKEANRALRVCLATGKLTQTLNTTEKIKGIPGAIAVGANLVSFDKDSFCSYGLEQAQNAPLSASAEFKIRSALTHLIARSNRQKLVFNNTIYIHWSKKPVPMEPTDLLMGADYGAVEQLLHSVWDGQKVLPIDSNTYYAMGLSGNGTRIVVRDWIETALPNIEKNLAEWFEDLSLVQPDGENIKRDFKFPDILTCLVRTELRELSATTTTTLFHGAFAGRSVYLPRNILALAVRRQQLDRNTKCNTTRMALIKACLIRSPNQTKGNIMTERVNIDNMDPAYLCGRILAVFDRLQYLAQGTVNAGVIERFYAGASITPALVMGRLFRNAQFHLSKVRGGIAVNINKELDDLSEALGASFPETLDLEAQGRFALGFYHQKALHRQRSAERKKNEKEAEPQFLSHFSHYSE